MGRKGDGRFSEATKIRNVTVETGDKETAGTVAPDWQTDKPGAAALPKPGAKGG